MCIQPTKNMCLINLTCFFTDLLSMVCDFMVLPPVCIFKRHLYRWLEVIFKGGICMNLRKQR